MRQDFERPPRHIRRLEGIHAVRRYYHFIPQLELIRPQPEVCCGLVDAQVGYIADDDETGDGRVSLEPRRELRVYPGIQVLLRQDFEQVRERQFLQLRDGFCFGRTGQGVWTIRLELGESGGCWSCGSTKARMPSEYASLSR